MCLHVRYTKGDNREANYHLMLLVLSMEDDNNKMAGETRRRVETDTDHREIDNVKADLFIQFFLLDRNYDIGTDLCE